MAKKAKAILRTQAEKDALRIATGRPTKYDPSIVDKITEYFNKPAYREVMQKVVTKTGDVIEVPIEKANDFPTLAGFALSIEVDRDTLQEWAKTYPDFSVAYKKAKIAQENFLMVNGLKGLVEQPTAIFGLKNYLGFSDKQEIKHEGSIDSKITVEPFDLEERKKQLRSEE